MIKGEILSILIWQFDKKLVLTISNAVSTCSLLPFLHQPVHRPQRNIHFRADPTLDEAMCGEFRYLCSVHRGQSGQGAHRVQGVEALF
jgi:hypothetical protein